MFAHAWIGAADLLRRKQLLCQLSHNHWPCNTYLCLRSYIYLRLLTFYVYLHLITYYVYLHLLTDVYLPISTYLLVLYISI